MIDRWACLAVMLAFAAEAIAQPIPRTPDGRPDFQGVWTANFISIVERPANASGLVVGEEEARKLVAQVWAQQQSVRGDFADPSSSPANPMRVDGEWRTSQITDPPDGRMPMTAEALASRAARRAQAQVMDDVETRPPVERCVASPGGVVLQVLPTENLRQFVQTRDHLVISSESGVGDTRIIGVGATKRPPGLIALAGDSTARWEGDALIVETTNLRNARWTPVLAVTDKAVVRESFSLLSANELLYRYTIVDPAIYSRPWSAEYSMMRISARMHENACHEHNYSLRNILQGARMAEERAAKAGKGVQQ
jgi:hypothetical protein